jgi:hypothetical protein
LKIKSKDAADGTCLAKQHDKEVEDDIKKALGAFIEASQIVVNR